MVTIQVGTEEQRPACASHADRHRCPKGNENLPAAPACLCPYEPE